MRGEARLSRLHHVDVLPRHPRGDHRGAREHVPAVRLLCNLRGHARKPGQDRGDGPRGALVLHLIKRRAVHAGDLRERFQQLEPGGPRA